MMGVGSFGLEAQRYAKEHPCTLQASTYRIKAFVVSTKEKQIKTKDGNSPVVLCAG